MTHPRAARPQKHRLARAAEDALRPLAEPLTPEGSETAALVHQWIHAVAAGGELAGGLPRERVVAALAEAGLYESDANLIQRVFGTLPFPPPPRPAFTFIDLFAGIGGFRLALQGLGGYCAFSSEWDRAAQQTYLRNYGELPFGDLTQFTREEHEDAHIRAFVPAHEILAGGFPCQPFSHAGVSARTAVGKQHGFACTTQGTLFFDLLRIAAARRPKVLFLENVRNIERHDGGRTFAVIRESIEELDYDFHHAIVDASTLVPQRRFRCFMVCFRKDLGVDFHFPVFSGPQLPLSSILEPNPDPSYTITDTLWHGHQNRTRRNLDRGTGFTAFEADTAKPSNTLVARYGKDGKECLIPQAGMNPRMLTTRECARLQGYPERFVLPDARTPAYKQFGNSVAVPVVQKIGANIVKALNGTR